LEALRVERAEVDAVEDGVTEEVVLGVEDCVACALEAVRSEEAEGKAEMVEEVLLVGVKVALLLVEVAEGELDREGEGDREGRAVPVGEAEG
jgi:hypothetical protein